MVRVAMNAADPNTAWRVRDALASHPLLGGATAQITVVASHHCVVLEGWTVDDEVKQLAMRLARRAAGQCMVQIRLTSRQLART
ncbi:MAG: BON domain-containing protein [Caldilineaceae bacterium]|nr:BON domain-containing protein [Caldilineaceae bacterium]